MDYYKIINIWLANIGQESGVDLRLDNKGYVCFAYDRQVPVTLFVPTHGDRLTLHAPLLPLVDMDGELLTSVLARALSYNLPGTLKTGLTLAVDEDVEAVYLLAQPELGALDALRFRSILMEFMAEAARLGKELRARAQESDGSPRSNPAAAADFQRLQGAVPLWG